MDYKSKLSLVETEIAIKFIKDNFENMLASKLHLIRVSAPLFVLSKSGLNDGLSGKEVPISFQVKGINDNIEIVHSLAKWKREALYRYNITTHNGIYTDMNAIRKDEVLDNLHSLYVDQWDYEIVIRKEERNLETLFQYVRDIYSVLKEMETTLNKRYPILNDKLPEDIVFVSSEELEVLYPTLTRKERELRAAKKYKAIFLYHIGYNLSDGKPHDLRAPDYDDWNLNGDIILYDELLNIPFEISSMGIRVDEESIITQCKYVHQEERLETPYGKMIINKELPYTIGGGIGQSRICMFLLEKAHIGEVQASIWSEEELALAKKNNIKLL